MDIKFDVNKVIEQIAEGLGVAVEKLYPILYKQAIIDGVIKLIWVGAILVFLFVFYKFAKYSIVKIQKEISEDVAGRRDLMDYPVVFFTVVIGGISSVLLIITGIELLGDSLTAFLNTEYYMIEKIVNKFQNK